MCQPLVMIKLKSFSAIILKIFSEIHPDLQDRLAKFKQHLKDRNKELTPLHQWELQGNILLMLFGYLSLIS